MRAECTSKDLNFNYKYVRDQTPRMQVQTSKYKPRLPDTNPVTQDTIPEVQLSAQVQSKGTARSKGPVERPGLGSLHQTSRYTHPDIIAWRKNMRFVYANQHFFGPSHYISFPIESHILKSSVSSTPNGPFLEKCHLAHAKHPFLKSLSRFAERRRRTWNHNVPAGMAQMSQAS